MSKYTIIDDPAADIIIDSELSIIVNNLKDLLGPWIESILLIGGFGRGEGGVQLKNGNYIPANDYDILVVIRSWKRIPSNLKNGFLQLENKLNKQVSVKQIDLVPFESWKLSIPMSTIVRYELKYGYKVLYGTLRNKIRCFPARFIPLSEGTRYFRTRGGGLLIARLLLDNVGAYSSKDRLELATLEINKAKIVLGDSYLIQHHEYNYSYLRRIGKFMELKNGWNIPDEVAHQYMIGIKNKLSPDFSTLSLESTNREWQQTTKLFLERFLIFESKRLGCMFDSLITYQNYVTREGKYIRKLFYDRITFYTSEESSSSLLNRLSTVLLLWSVINENMTTLNEVACLLGADSIKDDYPDAWREVTKRFLRQWHPSGIIEEICAE